ncbi:MAG: class I SAM-dependent methyltransferase [Steroidobacteraceae bacterium]
MKQLNWIDANEFSIDDIRFHCIQKDYSLRTRDDRLILLKDREMLDNYCRVLHAEKIRNVLEFGIFQGGSPALFTLWLELEKFVGIDVCAPVAAFDELIARHALGERIRTHYGVSQADEMRVVDIVRNEFGDTPIDLVIDDASHHYSRTRRAFEIAFPLLRPGGSYVIEDWGWAHWPTLPAVYRGQTALSMLIMELTMLCASRKDIVSEIRIFPSFVIVTKALAAPPLPDMRLDRLCNKRGVQLAGTKHLNIGGIPRLLAERFL